jgi:hypothetical protein
MSRSRCLRALLLAWAMGLSSLALGGGQGQGHGASEGSTAAAAARFAATREVDGRAFVLTGVGTHRADGEVQYEMALYVDELDARHAFPALAARAGGRTRQKLLASDHAQSFVVWGHFDKVAVLRMARPLPAGALRGPLEEPLAEVAHGAPGLAEKVEPLLQLFGGELKAGDELVVRTHEDGRIVIERDGEKREGPQSPKLARALWGAWLGGKPPFKDLTRALLEEIDLLGR